MFDVRCEALIERKPNMMIPWYLMASYAYYQLDSPIVTDGCFDNLCRRLLAEFSRVQHMHKFLIKRGDLMAGTCLLPRDSYPSITVSATQRLIADLPHAYIVRQSRVRLDPAPAKIERVRLDKPPTKIGRVRLEKPIVKRVMLERD